MVRLTTILSLSLFMFISCSPARLAEKGKTEKAFERAALQLERNNSGKASVGAVLAEAYMELQLRDYNSLVVIYASTSPERWERAIPILETLEERRIRVDRIRLSSERVISMPNFEEANYAGELASAKTEAANQLERQAKELLAFAKTGDRFAAREAYAKLEKRKQFATNTPRIIAIQLEAKELGTVFVGVRAYGNVRNNELENLGARVARNMSSTWVYVSPLGNANPNQFDLLVEVDVSRPFVSPILNDRSRSSYSSIVTERKKVGVDSTGTAIYEEIQQTVTAVVTTFVRSRRSEALATLAVVDPKTNSVMREQEFSGRYVFEDYETEVRGDRRALEGNTIPYLNRRFTVCPDDFVMEDNALEALDCALPSWNLDKFVDKVRLAHN